MSLLIKMSEATAIGLHVLTYVASRDTTVNAAELATTCRASEAHTMKVCQRLAKAGFLRARRGPGGGFLLARAAEGIRLREVYELFDGPMDAKYCMFATPACDDHQILDCIFGKKMTRIHQQIFDYFEETSLAEIAQHCHKALVKLRRPTEDLPEGGVPHPKNHEPLN